MKYSNCTKMPHQYNPWQVHFYFTFSFKSFDMLVLNVTSCALLPKRFNFFGSERIPETKHPYSERDFPHRISFIRINHT